MAQYPEYEDFEEEMEMQAQFLEAATHRYVGTDPILHGQAVIKIKDHREDCLIEVAGIDNQTFCVYPNALVPLD